MRKPKPNEVWTDKEDATKTVTVLTFDEPGFADDSGSVEIEQVYDGEVVVMTWPGFLSEYNPPD